MRIKKRSAVRSMEGRHAGGTIFCLGSGPSLNSEDLHRLNGQVVIFTNAAFLALKHCQPAAAYSYIQDTDAANRFDDELRQTKLQGMFRSFHMLSTLRLVRGGTAVTSRLFRLGDILIPPRLKFYRHKLIVFPEVAGHRYGFSDDLTDHICLGPSVIFGAVQLAAYFKAKRIVLLGVDMNYGHSASSSYFHRARSRMGVNDQPDTHSRVY